MASVFLMPMGFAYAQPKTGIQAIGKTLDASSEQAGLRTKGDTSTLSTRVGAIVKLCLGVIGTLAVLYSVYGGFRWITAAGNSSQVDEAKEIIKNAVIGIIVVSISYLIVALALAAGAGELV